MTIMPLFNMWLINHLCYGPTQWTEPMLVVLCMFYESLRKHLAHGLHQEDAFPKIFRWGPIKIKFPAVKGVLILIITSPFFVDKKGTRYIILVKESRTSQISNPAFPTPHPLSGFLQLSMLNTRGYLDTWHPSLLYKKIVHFLHK